MISQLWLCKFLFTIAVNISLLPFVGYLLGWAKIFQQKRSPRGGACDSGYLHALWSASRIVERKVGWRWLTKLVTKLRIPLLRAYIAKLGKSCLKLELWQTLTYLYFLSIPANKLLFPTTSISDWARNRTQELNSDVPNPFLLKKQC